MTESFSKLTGNEIATLLVPTTVTLVTARRRHSSRRADRVRHA